MTSLDVLIEDKIVKLLDGLLDSTESIKGHSYAIGELMKALYAYKALDQMRGLSSLYGNSNTGTKKVKNFA